MTRMIGTNILYDSNINHLTVHQHRNLAVRAQLDQRYGWGPPDFYINKCRELGITCLPIIKWAKPRPTDANSWGQWHAFLDSVIKRYPWKKYWQVWNEPNNIHQPAWVFPNPDEYRHFMADSAKRIKDINPNAIVVAGGIACGGYGGRQPPSTFNWDWFNQDRIVNRVAIHTYSSTSDGAAYAIERALNISEQPVWCTELGRKDTTDSWDADRVALWFDRVDAKTPTVPKYWFRFKDGEGDTKSFDGFGAVKSNWDAKKVWLRLAAAAARD